MRRVEGQVAFITGAARGQGQSIAVALAREGADIIAVDIRDLGETVQQVEAEGRRIVAAEVDISDLSALTDVVDKAVAELGRLDIVVANAGISAPGPALEMDEETWDRVIEINLTAQWKSVKASVPHIVAGGRGGSVVLTSSGLVMAPVANVANYVAAKTGLIGLMKVLAIELAPERIRVNTFHPTLVTTPMVLNESTYKRYRPDLEHPTRAEFEEAARARNPMSIVGLEEPDVFGAILYLVSDDGRYVTGTTHLVDAGAAL